MGVDNGPHGVVDDLLFRSCVRMLNKHHPDADAPVLVIEGNLGDSAINPAPTDSQPMRAVSRASLLSDGFPCVCAHALFPSVAIDGTTLAFPSKKVCREPCPRPVDLSVAAVITSPF